MNKHYNTVYYYYSYTYTMLITCSQVHATQVNTSVHYTNVLNRMAIKCHQTLVTQILIAQIFPTQLHCALIRHNNFYLTHSCKCTNYKGGPFSHCLPFFTLFTLHFQAVSLFSSDCSTYYFLVLFGRCFFGGGRQNYIIFTQIMSFFPTDVLLWCACILRKIGYAPENTFNLSTKC
jgi:hypothetical protein